MHSPSTHERLSFLIGQRDEHALHTRRLAHMMSHKPVGPQNQVSVLGRSSEAANASQYRVRLAFKAGWRSGLFTGVAYGAFVGALLVALFVHLGKLAGGAQ